MSLKFELHSSYSSFKEQILDIKRLFNIGSDVMHHARNIIKVIGINETQTVVKSFKIPHILNRIIYTYLRQSKAETSFKNAQRLETLDIETPEPIAFIEFYSFGLLKESFFISKKFDYDFTIREVLLDDSFTHRQVILETFAEFSSQLHSKGVWHLDYSPGNILIKKVENTFQISIVDINRMKFKNIPPQEGIKNFNKLWANENDLSIIAKKYAQLNSLDEITTINAAILYDQKNKSVKNFKKRLKSCFRDNC